MLSYDQADQMRHIWQSALASFARTPKASLAVFEDVIRRYQEPHRHYHNIIHIWHVLRMAFDLIQSDEMPPALDIATFLHDVIYDSRAKDNEERSAEYAHEILASLGADPPIRNEVARLILLTRHHSTTDDDRPGQILLDADLAILGADEAKYDSYAQAIRKEYHWVSDPDYRAGRRRVLEKFLTRPFLYYHPVWRASAEAKARANLAREIAALS